MSEKLSFHFQNVCLLITVYNRTESLERLLNSFEKLSISFHEIVVSDDASDQEHLSKLDILKTIYNFKLITSRKNKGLSNNINKGQDAVTAEYTLYIQEDFVPLDLFGEALLQSLQIMEEEKGIDLISYYSYFPYPYLKAFQGKFLEKDFNLSLMKPNHLKFYLYGDHPHLRRSCFFTKFGRYDENIKSDLAEYKMSLSFIKKGARALVHINYNKLFEQRNSLDEPSMIQRNKWRQGNSLLVVSLRKIYLIYLLINSSLRVVLMKRNIIL